MKFGYLLIHVPAWLILRCKQCPGRGYLRLCALLMAAVFSVCLYVFYMPRQGLKMLPYDENGQLEILFNQSFRKILGFAPVPCDSRAKVSEVLRLPQIKFLPNFKNPCWRERLDTPVHDIYAENGFGKYSFTYEKAFRKTIRELASRNSSKHYRLRCLPYFFLAGQPKCGSTDFYNKIVSHPDVASPPVKESHWWGKNRYGWCLNYTATIPFKDYVDIYDGAAMQIDRGVDRTLVNSYRYHPVVTGDASVSTLWSNDDWWRNPENCGLLEPKFTNADHIHFVLPQARIIVILRNPTDRLYSDFLYFTHSSKSQQDFHKEVTAAVDFLNDCIHEFGIRACVYNGTIAVKTRVRLRLGLYQVYLQDWLALFPRDQVLVVRLEDYSAEPLTVIQKAYKFLQLRTLSKEETDALMSRPMLNTRRDSDRKLGVMLPETRDLLDNFYRPYNVELAKLLGDNAFLWGDV